MISIDTATRQFALTSRFTRGDLQSMAITRIRNNVQEVLNDPARYPDPDIELRNRGITTQRIGRNLAYTDEQGNRLVDYTLGMDAATAGVLEASELETVWQRIGAQFSNIQVSNNQAVATADFARDLGLEKFAASNVSETLTRVNALLNSEARDFSPQLAYALLADIPRQFQGWVKRPARGASSPQMVIDPVLVMRREYQAELFRTPDSAMGRYLQSLNNIAPGETSFAVLSELLRAARSDNN